MPRRPRRILLNWKVAKVEESEREVLVYLDSINFVTEFPLVMRFGKTELVPKVGEYYQFILARWRNPDAA